MHNNYSIPAKTEIQPIKNGALVSVCDRLLKIQVHGVNVLLHDLKSHDERICTLEELNGLIEDGGAELLPEGPISRSSVPAHFDQNNSYLINDVPDSLRSAAAANQWAEKVKWLQRISARKIKRFRPDNYFLMELSDMEHEYQESCPFKPSTLYRAHLRLRKNEGNYRIIFPQYARRGGKGKSRLAEPVEKILRAVIESAKKPVFGLVQTSRIHEAVASQIIQLRRAEPNERYDIPSIPTISRRMQEEFSAYEIYKRKNGRERALRQFRQNGMRIRAERPLDIVEFDDKDTACFLIDDRTQVPWGRAHLTAGVDQATHSVMGINLSEHARSTHSAWAAFENAVYPKDPRNSDYADCKQGWEPYGHIGTVVMDNATYNATKDLQITILEYGSEIEYARPYQPTDKSCIEHFNDRLVKEFICHLPGWAGPKGERDSLEHGMNGAVYSLTNFKRAFNSWVTDVYSNKVINILGMSPRQAWNKALGEQRPYMPRKMPSIALAGTIRSTLKLRDSGGLMRKELRYQSMELHELTRHIGKKKELVVRYNPNNLGFILVLDPRTGGYMRVPCSEDARIVDFITDYQQSLILKMRRAAQKTTGPQISLLEARQLLIDNTSARLKSKSMSQRKAGVRTGVLPPIQENDESIEINNVKSISDIERFVMEIDAYELVGEEFEATLHN
jgi:putative transposase